VRHPPLVAGTGAQPHAVAMAGSCLDPHDAAQWARPLVAIAADRDLRARLSVAALKAAADSGNRPSRAELLGALLGAAAVGT